MKVDYERWVIVSAYALGTLTNGPPKVTFHT